MTQPHNPLRIRLTREVPLFRGKLPIGTEMTLTTVNAICESGGPCHSWDVHGLSADAFEFIHDGGGNDATPATLPTAAEPEEIELPSFV